MALFRKDIDPDISLRSWLDEMTMRLSMETNKLSELMERVMIMDKEQKNTIEELKNERTLLKETYQGTVNDLETTINNCLKELESKLGERIDGLAKTLNKKLDKEIDESKIKIFSQQLKEFNKNFNELKQIKKDMVSINMGYQKVVEFIDFLIKDMELTKKKKELYLETLTKLKKKLSSGLKGDEYKQALKEYQDLKDRKYEYQGVT